MQGRFSQELWGYLDLSKGAKCGIEKSSSIRITLEILILFRMIHSRAEENSSKRMGGRPYTEWEDHIEEIEPLPFRTREFPIRGMDKNIAKC